MNMGDIRPLTERICLPQGDAAEFVRSTGSAEYQEFMEKLGYGTLFRFVEVIKPECGKDGVVVARFAGDFEIYYFKETRSFRCWDRDTGFTAETGLDFLCLIVSQLESEFLNTCFEPDTCRTGTLVTELESESAIREAVETFYSIGWEDRQDSPSWIDFYHYRDSVRLRYTHTPYSPGCFVVSLAFDLEKRSSTFQEVIALAKRLGMQPAD